MPLPPAPTKRAALLSPDAYDVPARTPPRAKATRTRTDAPETAAAPHEGLKLVHDASLAAPMPQPAPTQAVPQLRDDSTVVQPLAANAKRTPATPSVAGTKARKRKASEQTKLFVLDTNVLLHDPMCLYRFEEHDVYLPMIVLEELDGHKKGMTEVARNARQTSRSLDALAGANGGDIADGLLLDSTGHREAGAGCSSRRR
jgi:PhoH-like ATPase